MDDQKLIALVSDGDQSAFAEIVHIYKEKIVNFLYQMTGDYQRAVDLSQETFLRVYFKADRYKPIAPLSSWIYAIAANLARTDLKRRRRMNAVSLDDVPPTLDLSTPSGEESDTGLARNLKAALDALHPRYRLPVVLKDVEGYSQEEIAVILKRPVGTVKARISRGRAILRKRLDRAAGHGLDYATREVCDERN
ncbi:MAG: sigma-70 family RNA polymerase sigma factor [Candidatus Aminicenantes bacterium]|nr:sigma-70 family RNA polymerase sigma factor [Candidatus Aminicenantes bacterium]